MDVNEVTNTIKQNMGGWGGVFFFAQTVATAL